MIGFYFAFCAVIDGVQYKTGMGISKKEARVRAAQLAVEELLSNLENDAVQPDALGKHILVLWNVHLLLWVWHLLVEQYTEMQTCHLPVKFTILDPE